VARIRARPFGRRNDLFRMENGHGGDPQMTRIDSLLATTLRRAFLAGMVAILTLLSCTTGCSAQRTQNSQASDTAISTLEALPHTPLPRGDFLNWCGDRTVLRVDQRLELYDGRAKAFPHSFPGGTDLECGDDGQRLVYIDDDWGQVYEADIPSGVVTRTVATYEKQLFHAKISFSPDLKNVASNRPLTLVPGAPGLKVIQLQGENVRHIQWHRDSSEFFVVSELPARAHSLIVEIFNAKHQKIGSGALPAGSLLRDGWFASSRELYLYLGFSRDEFGSGVVLKCRIENWKCDQIANNVLEASAGGEGILGMVRAIGKYSNDGETETFPPVYVAEIRNAHAQVVARQTFKLAERNTVGLAVAQSGTKAVLTWFGNAAGRSPEKPHQDGIMIDLSGGIK
jgi:hypothetical protein